MLVRSRLRVSVSRSIWSFWTPSMNSSRDSSPGGEKGSHGEEGVISLAAWHQGPELESFEGHKATAGEVAVRRAGKGARDQGLVQDPSHPGLWLGPYTLGTPPRGTPAPASSPSPLTSILENTVSVNSSALMVESPQGLMARMACGEEEVRGLLLGGGGAAVGSGGRAGTQEQSQSLGTQEETEAQRGEGT